MRTVNDGRPLAAWTDEEMLERLREWGREHGRPPTFNGWMPTPPNAPSRRAYYERFGSWAAAMGGAGLPMRTRGEYDRAAHRGPRLPPKVCGLCQRPFRGDGRKFCSTRCHGLSKRSGRGYLTMRVDGRNVGVHRLVAEQVMGRRLSPREVVHHVNAQRRDNRPENLWVFPSRAAHSRYEWHLRHGGDAAAPEGVIVLAAMVAALA